MTRAAAALRALTGCLRGEPVVVADWLSVIELANRTWLSPALYCALASSQRLGDLSEDERSYLAFIHGCNRDRNLRLRDQLLEAVSSFNHIGIKPVLLKGAITLLTAPDATIGSRLMSDIDIAVRAAELEPARSCLVGLGYEHLDGDRTMGRPGDAGALELRAHARAPAVDAVVPPSLRPTLVRHGSASAWVPSPTSQALHLIQHDMLKEGDYWRGRIDLRHLHDLAQLARKTEGVDWSCLRAAMPQNPGRNALETQLLTLQELFAIDIPQVDSRRSMARLQSWRRIMVAHHPVVGAPLRLAGNLVWGWTRVLASDGLHRRDAADLARRTSRILMGTNTGPKV